MPVVSPAIASKATVTLCVAMRDDSSSWLGLGVRVRVRVRVRGKG